MKTIEELIRQTINNKNPIPITHTAFFEVASIEKALKEAYHLGRAVGARDATTLLEDRFNDAIEVAALYEQKALKETIEIEEA
jgi:hypothetical protein